MKFKLFVSTLILITIVGCVPNSINAETQPSATNRLQITYIQLKEDQNFTEFYALDITCMSADMICFDEPKLLFQSLKAQNGEQNLPKGFITDYVWSPDGNNIVLASVGDILIGDINIQQWINITKSPDIDESKPKWPPNGKFIYYLACPRIIEGNYGGHGDCLLNRSNPSEKEETGLLRNISDSIISYDILPNEQKIVFTISSSFPISGLLYEANSDGTDSHQMTLEDVSENMPSFSPDGQKIVFVRSTIQYGFDSKDESDIILKDLTSGEEKNLTENFDNRIFSPSFSPDGKWVLFDAIDQDLNINVYLVSLENGNVIQVTENNKSGIPAWRWISE